MPTLLILSFLTLFLGPAVMQIALRRKSALRFIDAFVLCSVFGIVLFHVLPESLIHGGAPALVAACIGLFSPIFLGRYFNHGGCHIHRSLLSLASLGLLAHALLDGMALYGAQHDGTGANFVLAIAVVLHRLPEGVGIWRLMEPRAGKFWAMGALLFVAFATSLGFFFGESIIVYSNEQTLAVFEGLMAGVLLHVIFHRHHLEEFDGPEAVVKGSPISVGLGALCGVVLVLGLFATQPVEHSHAKSSVRIAHSAL